MKKTGWIHSFVHNGPAVQIRYTIIEDSKILPARILHIEMMGLVKSNLKAISEMEKEDTRKTGIIEQQSISTSPLHSVSSNKASSNDLFRLLSERCPPPQEYIKTYGADTICRWMRETFGEYNSESKIWIYDEFYERSSLDENGRTVTDCISSHNCPKESPSSQMLGNLFFWYSLSVEKLVTNPSDSPWTVVNRQLSEQLPLFVRDRDHKIIKQSQYLENFVSSIQYLICLSFLFVPGLICGLICLLLSAYIAGIVMLVLSLPLFLKFFLLLKQSRDLRREVTSQLLWPEDFNKESSCNQCCEAFCCGCGCCCLRCPI
jgi:hypothetical protein